MNQSYDEEDTRADTPNIRTTPVEECLTLEVEIKGTRPTYTTDRWWNRVSSLRFDVSVFIRSPSEIIGAPGNPMIFHSCLFTSSVHSPN
ncbi:hypothetical protein AVEN_23599-1 [Araneus ventricosus]|uniref:Uncharacterized protein n=1 Tax=Araneus ventricosus TaxID=182803 RepID=A0A4Y2BIH7_ARAVE|nr:hypothetical protein AVEN_23599-1 [Araneus ventricosus]